MSNADNTVFRRAALEATDAEIDELRNQAVRALEGDSNDAEHDALVEFARFFGFEWTDADDVLADEPEERSEAIGWGQRGGTRTQPTPLTSLRPRPGETAEQTVDRVVNAVQRQALPLAYTIGEELGMSDDAIDELLTAMARANPMALIGGFNIDVAIVAFAAALQHEDGITPERIRQATQTLIEAYFVATVG